MLLRWVDNTFLEITKTTDFLIRWLGMCTDGRQASIEMCLRGTGGGGKLSTLKIADEVREAFANICFDRVIDLWWCDRLPELQDKCIIRWDVGDFWREEWFSVETTKGWVLRVWLYKLEVTDPDSKREIWFDVGIERVEWWDSIIVVTQMQFAQLVNLALVIQDYSIKWWE